MSEIEQQLEEIIKAGQETRPHCTEEWQREFIDVIDAFCTKKLQSIRAGKAE